MDRGDNEPMHADLRAIEPLGEQSAPIENRARRDSFRIVAVYFVLGAIYFPIVHLTQAVRGMVGLVAGLGYLLVSSVAGYIVGRVYLGRLYESQSKYGEAQRSLRQKDIAIRQAYVDVLAAVTGGKLILMTDEELEPILGPTIVSPVAVSDREDVAVARRRLADVLAPITDRVDDIEVAVSEALTNALKHAGKGEYWVADSNGCVQVVVKDEGPGIDFHTLPKATLVPGYSTIQSLGMGFTLMLNLADRVLLASEAGSTVLTLEFDIANPSAPAEERTLLGSRQA